MDELVEMSKNEPPKKKRKLFTRRFWLGFSAIGLAVLLFLGGMLTTWLSLDSEMRVLIRVKNRINDEYYEEVSDEEFYDAIFGAVNNEVLDAYSAYMTPTEYLEKTLADSGYYEGLGIYSQTETVDGKSRCLVLLVYGNTPAERAGIREGDSIIGYGASETEISDSADGDGLVEFINARALGETVYLRLQKENGSEQIVSIAKESYQEGFVLYRTNTASYTYQGASGCTATNYPLTCLDDDTAYLRLTGFLGSADKEFLGAMARFKSENKKNLVLDLRLNTGGKLDILSGVASVLCKNATAEKPLIAVADYGNDRENGYFYATSNSYYEYFTSESKIFVLADDYTASASECLLGAMLDYGTISMENICLSERNGEAKTYGKGIMQETKPVFLGGALRLTVARILWPVSNRCIHGVGILPTDGTKTVAELYGDKEISQAFMNLTA